MVQGVLNGARKVARTVRPGKWGADKANAKGQLRIELGAAAHFVKARLWGPLLQLVAPGTIKWGAGHGLMCARSGGRRLLPWPRWPGRTTF